MTQRAPHEVQSFWQKLRARLRRGRKPKAAEEDFGRMHIFEPGGVVGTLGSDLGYIKAPNYERDEE